MYVDKSRQMDVTEVNDRAESLCRRRRELSRMRMEEKHQKKQKQIRHIHTALNYIKLPLGPRLYILHAHIKHLILFCTHAIYVLLSGSPHDAVSICLVNRIF